MSDFQVNYCFLKVDGFWDTWPEDPRKPLKNGFYSWLSIKTLQPTVKDLDKVRMLLNDGWQEGWLTDEVGLCFLIKKYFLSKLLK